MEAIVAMLHRITAKVSTSCVVWRCCARISDVQGKPLEAIDHMQRSVRSACVSGWNSEPAKLRAVTDGVQLLIDVYENGRKPDVCARMQSSFLGSVCKGVVHRSIPKSC